MNLSTTNGSLDGFVYMIRRATKMMDAMNYKLTFIALIALISNSDAALGNDAASNGTSQKSKTPAKLPDKIDAVFEILPRAESTMGSTRPYKKELVRLVEAAWPQSVPRAGVVFIIDVAKSGQVIKTEILSGINDRKTKETVVGIINKLKPAPLPDWYRGESLTFQIKMRPAADQEKAK